MEKSRKRLSEEKDPDFDLDNIEDTNKGHFLANNSFKHQNIFGNISAINNITNTQFMNDETINNLPFSHKRATKKLIEQNTSFSPFLETGMKRPCIVYTNLNDFKQEVLFRDKTNEKDHKKGDKRNSKIHNSNVGLKNCSSPQLLNTSVANNNSKAVVNSGGKTKRTGNLSNVLVNNSILINNQSQILHSISNFSNIMNASTSNTNNNTLNTSINSINNNNNSLSSTDNLDIYMPFRKPTMLFSIITKYLDESIDNYIHHNLSILEYDEQDIFIFIFKTNIYITKFIDDNCTEIPLESPVIYKIKFLQIFHKELEVTEDTEDYNSIIIQYYENDMTKKSEM